MGRHAACGRRGVVGPRLGVAAHELVERDRRVGAGGGDDRSAGGADHLNDHRGVGGDGRGEPVVVQTDGELGSFARGEGDVDCWSV